MPNHRLIPFGDNIWIVAGKTVPFFGLPYSTRMTVVRLDDGTLWLHSPIELSRELLEEVKALGEVSYLLAPNSLHHLFVKDWQQAFPNALSYATEELAKNAAICISTNCCSANWQTRNTMPKPLGLTSWTSACFRAAL